MKFGLCSGIDMLSEASRLGFDYLEPPVSGVAAMSDDEFALGLATVKSAAISCSVFNVMFPASIRLIGGSTDEEIAAYLRLAFKRVSLMGGKLVVFGSGRSRFRPESIDYGTALRRLTDVARLMAGIAQEHGLTVAVEPLHRAETNMICSMAEGAALVAAVDKPNVRLLSDYFHVVMDNEPISDVARLGGFCHTHIAAKQGRRFPTREEGDAFRAFFANLKATGYQGDMSIEGGTDDLSADAPKALALLKKLWAEA